MTKEVLVSVRGLQNTPEGQNDTVETISPGVYYFKNGKHYFIYEEVMEGLQENIKNMVKVSENRMELIKKGGVSVHMLFEKKKKNVTYYYTPFGNLMVGIDAYYVDIHETDDEITVEVEYALDINNEHVSNCHIRLQAQAQGSGQFHLEHSV